MLALLSLVPTLALPKSPDIILSSGFLCFSSHAGALQALEAAGLTDSQSAVVGVSSGALAAAMLAAGRSATDIGEQLSAQRPIKLVRPTITPWRGLCSTRALERRMRELLPATFEELERPLALGVLRRGRRRPSHHERRPAARRRRELRRALHLCAGEERRAAARRRRRGRPHDDRGVAQLAARAAGGRPLDLPRGVHRRRHLLAEGRHRLDRRPHARADGARQGELPVARRF